MLNLQHNVLSRTILTSLLLTGITSYLAHSTHAEAKGPVVEVNAGPVDREDVVLDAALPPTYNPEGPLHLKRLDNNTTVPAQRLPGKTPRIAWILEEPLPAGKIRRYEVCSGAAENSPPPVTVRDDGERLLVDVSGKPVFAYNCATVPSPDPKHPYYARSGYLHAVYTPAGHVLTDDFNPEHAHQHGVMFAWRKGTFEGRATNPWHQAEKHGRVEHVKVEELGDGPVFGRFTTKLRQLDLTAPDGPKPILDETWNVRVANLSKCFVFDIEMIQTCAGKSPYTVEKVHYGALAVRGSREWNGRPAVYDFLTDLGKTRETGDQTRAKWVDFTGPAGGGKAGGKKSAGIVVMCHPDNFRFPQPVRLHPWMPYFCFTPASLGAFEITPERPYVSRFRFVCHDGRLTAEELEGLWEDYSRPAETKLVKMSEADSR